MTGKSRLAKIETRLTPQQIVIAYLDEIMRRFGSFLDWGDWAAGNMSEAPLIRVPKAAREAVHNTTTGLSRDSAAEGEEGAVREAILLVKLFLKVTGGLVDRAENYGLQASLCARGLQVLLLQEVIGQGPQGVEDSAGAEGMTSKLEGELSLECPCLGFGRDCVADIRAQVQQHLGKLYLHRLVINAVRDNYFGGHPILFAAEAHRLEGLIETAEALSDEYNGFVRAHRDAPGATPDGEPSLPSLAAGFPLAPTGRGTHSPSRFVGRLPGQPARRSAQQASPAGRWGTRSRSCPHGSSSRFFSRN